MYSLLNSPLPVPYDSAVQALALPICGVSVRAGFPSPADDFAVERLDIMQLLVKHPQATYFGECGATLCAMRVLMTAASSW